MTDSLLAGLDAERQVARDGRLARENDGGQCRIVFADCLPAELDALIAAEQARAAGLGCALEWKTYAHDPLTDLPERLLAAGFAAGDTEQVMVLELTARSAAIGSGEHQVRRLDASELADYSEVCRQTGRENAEQDRRHLAAAMLAAPGEISVHVAYTDGEPAACGRLHVKAGSRYAELAGGRTKTTHRRRGLFTALVGTRLREARERGRSHAFVDALPTSAPILARHGFVTLTTTTPYVYRPRLPAPPPGNPQGWRAT